MTSFVLLRKPHQAVYLDGKLKEDFDSDCLVFSVLEFEVFREPASVPNSLLPALVVVEPLVEACRDFVRDLREAATEPRSEQAISFSSASILASSIHNFASISAFSACASAHALASRTSANSKDAFNSARLLASSICRISQDLLVVAV